MKLLGQSHYAKNCSDESKLSNLDATVECKKRERNVALRQPDIDQSASKAKPVQKSKYEGDCPRIAGGETALPSLKPKDLAGQKQDTERDARLDRRSWNMDNAQSSKRKRKGMRDGETRCRYQKHSEAAYD